jgi:hypothetical protein
VWLKVVFLLLSTMELLKKLRIANDKPLWLINAPANCLDYFTDFTVKQKPGKEKPVRQLILFARDSKEINHYLPVLADYVGHETLFWIFYPKKTGAYTSDLIQMSAWDIVFKSGYRGQTSVSVDDNWTGLRITNAPRKKPSDCDLPMEERKAEGIDFVNRTVTLPKDAQATVDKYKGLSDYFYAQSFTCKKEHVTAITEAKKEETRAKRIEKMVEMLLPKMHAFQMKNKK